MLIALNLFAAPLLIGGGPGWATTASLALALVLALAFVILCGFRLRPVPLMGAALVALGFTALQLVPLPAAMVAGLSPMAVAIRTGVGLPTQPSIRYLPLTLDVPATLIELAKAMAYLGVFVITAQIARRQRYARRLLFCLAGLGAFVAGLSFAHRVLGARAIYGLYWVRESPGLGFFAPFVNGNHAAALLVLTSVVALGLAFQETGWLRWLAWGCVGIGVLVLPTTGARASFAGLTVATAGFGARLLARRYGWAKAAALSIFLVGLVAAPVLLTNEVLKQRLSGGFASLFDNQKTRGWKDALALIADFRLTGVGRGAFEGPISAYRHASEGIRLSYPESLPLQLASEWGWPALAIFPLVALVALRRVLPWLAQLETAVCGAAFALLGLCLQELASFSLELTGVAVPALVAVGVVVGRIQDLRDPHRQQTKTLSARWVAPFLALWTLCFGTAVWAMPRTAWVEGERLRDSLTKGSATYEQAAAASARHPADPYLALLAHFAARAHNSEIAEHHLQRAMRLYPVDGGLKRTWAEWLVQQNRPAEAALAFRKSALLGAPTDPHALLQSLPPHLVLEAVPQTQGALMQLAFVLQKHQHTDLAQTASARALEVAEEPELAATERTTLALSTQSREFKLASAEDLLLLATQPSSFVEAAATLQAADDWQGADDALARGLERHPHNGHLVVEALRLLMQRNAPDRALAFANSHDDSGFSFDEQIAFQTLKATAAEQHGDLVSAVTARARVRLLSARAGHR